MDKAEGITRREVMQSGVVLAVAATLPASAVDAKPETTALFADLHWLGGQRSACDTEVVWGVPWPRGALPRATKFQLTARSGPLPVQSWPLAYWPDGSLKWTGHAASGPIDAEGLRLAPGRPSAPARALTVEQTPTRVTVRSGNCVCVIPTSGAVLIESLGEQAANVKLVCLREDRSQADTKRTRRYTSRVDRVLVEQSGPVRGLVRIEGRHVGEDGRAWLPFIVRATLHAGGRQLRLVHSFVFDGDAHEDFICGLGLEFEVPLRDELHNRHVRFAGAGSGLWSESVRNLPGWAERFAPGSRFPEQLAGRPVPRLAEMTELERAQLATVPAWDSYKLFQSSADHFDILKRNVATASWLQANHGTRAAGTGYLGGTSGGVVFGIKDFWQRHPAALEIQGATTDKATVTVWLWAPDAPAMDLRHYSDRAHGLELQYEDVEPGHSTPLGIARTSEIDLWALDTTPSLEEMAAYVEATRDHPRLVCDPAYYHSHNLFGTWGLPDRSTPVTARLEQELDRLLAFYLDEVDRRQWYGFWHYGDVMHTYDADRHVWRYDVGGYAWSNSELIPDLWLWTAFLRSGRADLFRMAEAMTRHTGEVDVYHLGPFNRLGSRHNVVHWGDGAKEVRISQALLRRIYYYLSADERTGDLMREVVDADAALVTTDPLRHILQPSRYPTHARTGPDWFAFASNWLVEWERTGDTRWRDKIAHGLDVIASMPLGMFSGPQFGYDPATATLHDLGLELSGSYHLVSIFGGAELVSELLQLIEAPKFEAAWLRFCELYNAGDAARAAALGRGAPDKYFGFPVWHARLTAYAAMRKNDPSLARRAWNELLSGLQRTATEHFPMQPQHLEGLAVLAPLDEVPWMETNHASQWSLNLIELLGMVGAYAPRDLPGAWRT
jgi:hypothetical protein